MGKLPYLFGGPIPYCLFARKHLQQRRPRRAEVKVFCFYRRTMNAVRTPASETWCWRVSRTFVKAFNSGSVCSSQKPIKNTRKRNVRMLVVNWNHPQTRWIC
jgi:hypothetical protein